MKENTAKLAAKWWADHIREGARLDNGDRSYEGAMAMGMAKMLQKKELESWTIETIDAFEQELADRFFKYETDGYVCILNDYAADPVFHECAQKVGVRLGIATLPWKTSMYILTKNGKDTIKVSLGYGGKFVELDSE